MPQNDAEHMVMAQRIATVENAVDRIADAMERLVRLEERHTETRDGVVRAHDRIDALTARCNEVEQSVVPLKWMRRVLAALERIGWRTKRQTGSHRILARPGWPDTVFAFHDDEEIGPRMLARIARITGLRPDDL